MRDILFKAKRIENGEWVEGSLIDSGNHYQVFIYPHDDSASTMSCKTLVYHGMVAVDSNTICQYTGLTDKNGNKIWENDIVRFVCVTPSVKQEMIKQVKYRRHGGISPFWWSFECNRCGSFCDIKEVEVVGNIHDNPEILGGSE